jgi:radical SAM additional 4Fe4S-binding domain
MIFSYPDIHIFSYNGKYYLIDFSKGDILKIDEARYLALQTDKTANRVPTFTSLPPINVQADHQKRITLLVAQDCNLACDYCFADKGVYGNQGKMTVETACRAIDFLLHKSEEKIEYIVNFLGGEPLLNFPVIKKVAEYTTSISNRKGIPVYLSMTTNGTILNDEILEFLKKYDVSVTVSIDGPKEIHDRYRKFADGSGSFETIVENLQRMVAKLTKDIAVQVTLTKQSLSMDESRTYFEKMGFKHIEFSRASDHCKCNGTYFREEIKDNVPGNRSGDDLQMALKRYSGDQIVSKCKNMKKFFTESLKKVNYYNCYAGIYTCAVDIKGDIYVCCLFVGMPEFRIGNVWDGMDEGQYTKFFNDFEKSREVCNLCWARTLCGRGCFRDAVKDGRFCEPDEQFCNQRRWAIEKTIYSYFEISDYCDREGFK